MQPHLRGMHLRYVCCAAQSGPASDVQPVVALCFLPTLQGFSPLAMALSSLATSKGDRCAHMFQQQYSPAWLLTLRWLSTLPEHMLQASLASHVVPARPARVLECSQHFALLLYRSLLAAVKRAVGFLLAVGANPNARYAVKATDDPVLMLAVFAAANFGDWGFVEMLLRHGADPDARSGAIAVGWLQRT